MLNKKYLEQKLNFINENIEIYKRNAIEAIKKENIIPATSDLLIMRDLKEQQILINELLKGE